MSRQSPVGDGGPPEVIYIIRHGEKPAEPPDGHGKHQDPGPPHGVDFHGRKDEHSLLPRGWQRSGALAALFHPASGPSRTRLRPPGTLLAADVDAVIGDEREAVIQQAQNQVRLARPGRPEQQDPVPLAGHAAAVHLPRFHGTAIWRAAWPRRWHAGA